MLVNELLNKDPAEVRKWAEQAVSNPVFAEFPWLTLAWAATHRATSTVHPESREKSFNWARAAQLIYCHLKKISRELDQRAYHLSLLNLRSALILKYGCDSTEPLLDAREFEQAVLINLKDTPNQTRDLARNWREQPVQILQQLRYIKNQLSPLRLLVEKGILEPSPELKVWLNTWNTLP